MKKIFTLAFMAAAAMAMNAQSAFNVAPDYYNFDEAEGTVLMLLGESLSSNNTYVSGQDLQNQYPFVWNTETGELKVLVVTDDVRMPINWDDEGNETEWTTETMTRSGSFRFVNPDGLAVGSLVHQGTFVSYPVLFDAKTGEHTYLYYTGEDAGGEGYAITDDGSVIAGFYFDASWKTSACVWTDGGKTRTDLPCPSAEEVGFPIDYVSCRYMTADGSRILGYVQDFYSGDWVAVLWNKQQDGAYALDCEMAKTLYQPRPYTEVEGEEGWPVVVYEEITDPKPFTKLEPLAISKNGEWGIMVVNDYKDESDGSDFFAAEKTLRYNFKTNTYDTIEVTEGADEGAKLEFFSIADDGTAVGRFTGPFDWENWSQSTDGVIWPVGSTSFVTIAELFADDPYVEGWSSSALSCISADGKTAMGYASDDIGAQTTFVVTLPNLSAGIGSVLASKAEDAAFDLQGRRVENAQPGIRIVGGKKVMR